MWTLIWIVLFGAIMAPAGAAAQESGEREPVPPGCPLRAAVLEVDDQGPEPAPPAPAPASRLRAAALDAAWMSAAAALDLAATRYALDRCASCYEAHPFARS